MNLREIHGLGVTGFMAADAELRDIRQLRLDACGILGMLGERSVAGLAGDVRVAPGLFHIVDVVVAAFAGFMAGIGNGVSHDFVERGAPIEAVLTKTLRYQKTPDDEKKNGADGKRGCEPD